MNSVFSTVYELYRQEVLQQMESFFLFPFHPYSLLSGGKQLRSLLFFTANSQTEQNIRTAFLIELVHAASLVHDDIVDESPLRRGRSTLFIDLGTPKTTASGYYLLAYLQEQLHNQSPVFYAKCFHTLEAMCRGQLQEIRQSGSNGVSMDDYLDAISLKTASLFRLSAGWIDDRFDESEAHFGWLFGQVFQIIDDIQDFCLTEGKSGKPAQQDTIQQVMTLPVLLARKKGQEHVDNASLQEACSFGQERLESAKSRFSERTFLKTQLQATLEALSYQLGTNTGCNNNSPSSNQNEG